MKKMFQLNDIVYHITDQHQTAGIVTGILERPTGYVYLVSFGIDYPEREYFATELIVNRNFF